MRYTSMLKLTVFLIALCLASACAEESNSTPNTEPSTTDTSDASDDSDDSSDTSDQSDASDPSDATDPTEGSDESDASDQSDDSDDTDPTEGQTATSCGSESQGLTPVDCTVNGDTSAQCVFGNHCLCSDGFECEDGEDSFSNGECSPGVVCVPETIVEGGHSPSACGSPDQGLTPIDCTAEGDINAECVFSNHCMCSEGYVCEDSPENFTETECGAGVMCIPATTTGGDAPDWSTRPAGQCETRDDCPEFPSGAQTCSPFPGGRCVGGCGTNDDCPGEAECRFGACVETCIDDLDCHLGMRCSGGSCLQQNCQGGICPTSGYICNSSDRCVRSSCSADNQCAPGFFCSAGYCVESYWAN